MDTAGRVIYAGTLSKILYPSLRLGFMIAPEQLVESLSKVRSVMDQHSPSIDQATLARFITEGYFLSHLKRMRNVYAKRREFFIEQFEKSLSRYFDLQITPAGLHFVAWLRDRKNYSRFLRVRESTAIRPRPISDFCIDASPPPAFVFGFAAWPAAQTREGLARSLLAFERT
jgi:GntR family transcriptional regulator/MocR family aminotransferase